MTPQLYLALPGPAEAQHWDLQGLQPQGPLVAHWSGHSAHLKSVSRSVPCVAQFCSALPTPFECG